MTKYTSNEQYEKDKAKYIGSLYGLNGETNNAIRNLLRQSKWVGNADSEGVNSKDELEVI